MSNYIPPAGPEDERPGATFYFNHLQRKAIWQFVQENRNASDTHGLMIEDRGAGYYQATIRNADGEVVAEKPIFPLEELS